MGNCDLHFEKKDKKLLVDIVKMVRAKNMRGSKGGWGTFLASIGKDSKTAADPSLHAWTVLASFLGTMQRKDDIQLLELIREWMSHSHEMEILEERDPLPVTPEEELVQTTRAHVRFKEDYRFESYNEGWSSVHRGTSQDVGKPENLVALDCEMADCIDGTLEVVRVCAVDRNLKTLIDTLVRPSKVVVDYRSHVSGVTLEDLVSVTVTQTDIQKRVKEMLKPGSIVVGHSVHHDLKALKIHHRRVIDTQYIFPIVGRLQAFVPGLRDMCKAVLGYDFREDDKPHDCLEDARVPMKLVLHCLEHGPCAVKLPDKINETLLSNLLLHRIPIAVTAEDLKSLFSKKNYHCQIQTAQRGGRRNSTFTSMYAVFKDEAEANSAFAGLQGYIGTDSMGHAQKTVFFYPKLTQRNGAKVKIFVRKMGFDTQISKNSDSNHEARDSKLSQSSEAENDVKTSDRRVPMEKSKADKIQKFANRLKFLHYEVVNSVQVEDLSASDKPANGTDHGFREVADEPERSDCAEQAAVEKCKTTEKTKKRKRLKYDMSGHVQLQPLLQTNEDGKSNVELEGSDGIDNFTFEKVGMSKKSKRRRQLSHSIVDSVHSEPLSHTGQVGSGSLEFLTVARKQTDRMRPN